MAASVVGMQVLDERGTVLAELVAAKLNCGHRAEGPLVHLSFDVDFNSAQEQLVAALSDEDEAWSTHIGFIEQPGEPSAR